MFNKPRLLTPGPTPIPERVRLVMAQDMIHHRKATFQKAMHRVQRHLQPLFGTTSPVLPLACSGTGAMAAAVHGLFTRGEKVLVVEGGKFGQRWREIAAMRGLSVTTLNVEWGRAVDADAVRAALDAEPDLNGVLIQLSETSTGVLHPVREVAAITRQRDVLLVADGISAVGLSPCPMDDWGIDCLLTGSQKGLMVPPGLALLALSARAWEKAETVNPECFYFNLPKERAQVEKGQTAFTTPVSLILGLAESLDMIMEIGLDALYRKQWALTMMARQGVRALGLELFVPRDFAWGATSVSLPAGVDGTLIVRLAAEKYGVFLAGGQDHLKGRILRIGHMGWVDWADLAAGLHAVAMSLRDAGGYTAARDYLEQALAAYHAGLAVAPGTPIPPARS